MGTVGLVQKVTWCCHQGCSEAATMLAFDPSGLASLQYAACDRHRDSLPRGFARRPPRQHDDGMWWCHPVTAWERARLRGYVQALRDEVAEWRVRDRYRALEWWTPERRVAFLAGLRPAEEPLDREEEDA